MARRAGFWGDTRTANASISKAGTEQIIVGLTCEGDVRIMEKLHLLIVLIDLVHHRLFQTFPILFNDLVHMISTSNDKLVLLQHSPQSSYRKECVEYEPTALAV